MPCDTRITTSVVELAKADRKRLAAVLGELGWDVVERDGVLTAYGRSGEVLRVSGGVATLATNAYGDAMERVLTSIRQAYAARTVAEVSKRFGFRVAGTQQLNGGAKRLVLRR